METTVAEVLFVVFAVLTCGAAVAVVLSQNVVRMAFWLIISLGSVSGLFFLLNADFVGAMQLLVYVGGTLVVLVFGVMLTSSGPYQQIKASPGEGVIALFVGFLTLTMLLGTLWAVDWNTVNDKISSLDKQGQPVVQLQGRTGRPIGLGLLGLRPDKDLGAPEGQLSTGYLLPFEIASVHLLVVLIGAAYLARAKKRRVEVPKTIDAGSSQSMIYSD